MAKKDQEKVNFLEPEETNESKTRLVKNGHTYKVVLTWRGKTYMVQMFVPSVSRPTRQQVEKEVQKIYPDAKLMSFLPRDLEPGEPTVMMGEEKRDEYGDIVGGPKISKKKKAKNLAKNEPDEQHTTTTSEAIEPEGMKLRDVERIKRQKQLSDAAKKAPEVKNKIVPIKTSTTSEMVDLPKFSQDSVNKAKGADSSFVKPNSKKPKVTLRNIVDRIKNDPKRDQARKDAMKDMGGENVNEVTAELANRALMGANKKFQYATSKAAKDKAFKQSKKFQSYRDKKVADKNMDYYKSDEFEGAPVDQVKKILNRRHGYTNEEFVKEDDMKGMSVKSGHKRPTKSGAGMTAKGVAAYRRRNPGSKLKTAVTGKVKKGSKDAKRRKSYCARSAGQMKKFPKAAKDPNSRLRQARRRWKC